MSKKKKIVIFILFIIILFVVISIILGNKTVDNKIENYIINYGFSQIDESSMYKKELSDISIDNFFENTDNDIDSEYNILYFDISNYVLSKIKMEYRNNIYTYFSSKYDYINDTLNYQYEITKGDIYVNLSGNYDIDSKDFTCLVNSYKNINIDEAQNVFCDKIEYDVLDFSVQIYDVINDVSLIEEAKNKVNND